ncbi:transketolase family protein [Trinickia acidisoli]|uniref:transketolase family protein n=1 Tax=Trinickia acidisoli TaxID=2767482 RepID=UPI001A8E6F59|nr:transketolase C-terminal domain-containing protein [Trinickia acidisoli]
MSAATTPLAMQDAFLSRVVECMAADRSIFVVSADFGSPVMDRIREAFPDRFLNVGVAEQNLINVCAGLALEGFKVFAYAIAPFLTMRCYEQIRVNLALLSAIRPMSVTLVGVGAGCSYVALGPTYQCYEDIGVMRALPNLEILSPSDDMSAAGLVDHCLTGVSVRYVRLDAQVLQRLYTDSVDSEQGFSLLRPGKACCVIATGYMSHVALRVAEILEKEGITIAVIDLVKLTSFCSPVLTKMVSRFDHVVTIEEGFHGRGGLDACMREWAAKKLASEISWLHLGVKPMYLYTVGSREMLHERLGLGARTISRAIRDFVSPSHRVRHAGHLRANVSNLRS